MGCGCRGNKSNDNANKASDNKSGLDRYAFLSPAQIRLKQAEEKKKLEEESTRNGEK
jgi:hypothetical protein